MVKNITVIAGPCALRSYVHTMQTAQNVAIVRDALQPFGVDVGYRGGAWKPRTLYYDRKKDEKVFDGVKEKGLEWLAEVAKSYGLFVDSECMSEMDFRHFEQHLDAERDNIQIGARTSQAYGLLYAIGGSRFGALLKNPQHGVDVEEAVGSLQRLRNNRHRIYCIRGQKRSVTPYSENDEALRIYLESLMNGPFQHPDSRNVNNIDVISRLRTDSHFSEDGNEIFYDPSHTWGGKTDEIRSLVGRYAVLAITDFGYDGILIDVDDSASFAPVDGDQALLTTRRNVDWSHTNYGQLGSLRPYEGKEPSVIPMTLVDIASELIDYQATQLSIYPEQVALSKRRLEDVKWNPEPGNGNNDNLNGK